jgi:hypothetical protein
LSVVQLERPGIHPKILEILRVAVRALNASRQKFATAARSRYHFFVNLGKRT